MRFSPYASSLFLPSMQPIAHEAAVNQFMAEHSTEIPTAKLIPRPKMKGVSHPGSGALRWGAGGPFEGGRIEMKLDSPRSLQPRTIGRCAFEGGSQGSFQVWQLIRVANPERCGNVLGRRYGHT